MISRAHQEALCDALSDDPRSIRWIPDDSAIGGGVAGFIGGTEVARVYREVGTLKIRTLRTDGSRYSWRVTASNRAVGRGWIAAAAAFIKAADLP